MEGGDAICPPLAVGERGRFCRDLNRGHRLRWDRKKGRQEKPRQKGWGVGAANRLVKRGRCHSEGQLARSLAGATAQRWAAAAWEAREPVGLAAAPAEGAPAGKPPSLPERGRRRVRERRGPPASSAAFLYKVPFVTAASVRPPPFPLPRPAQVCRPA